MKPVNHTLLAGVSALAVLVGLSTGASAEDFPVAPLSDIETSYESPGTAPSADKPSQSKLEELERAIQAEMQARGGQPRPATVPTAEATKDGRQEGVAPSNVERASVKPSPASQARTNKAVAKTPDVTTQAAPAQGIIPTVAAGVELPAVPSSVMTGVPQSADDNTPLASVINMKPGTTELVAVAEGHLNRFITPFAEPAVVTTSDAKYRVSGNVVYIATTTPATVYITPKGDETVALPLALVPRKIPPREIRLEMGRGNVWNANFGSSFAGGTVANKKAQRWEESQPYVETLRALFRDLARGKMPTGYQMRAATGMDTVPACSSPAGIRFRFDDGQFLEGSHLQVVVGTVTNSSGQSIELMEPWCANRDVAAIAYWPSNVLAPGQSTEVFVVRRPNEAPDEGSVRPSLLMKAGGVR